MPDGPLADNQSITDVRGSDTEESPFENRRPMLNDDAGEQLYAIDMAPAHTSALAHHVPVGKLKTARTNWIPQLEI